MAWVDMWNHYGCAVDTAVTLQSLTRWVRYRECRGKGLKYKVKDGVLTPHCYNKKQDNEPTLNKHKGGHRVDRERHYKVLRCRVIKKMTIKDTTAVTGYSRSQIYRIQARYGGDLF